MVSSGDPTLAFGQYYWSLSCELKMMLKFGGLIEEVKSIAVGNVLKLQILLSIQSYNKL